LGGVMQKLQIKFKNTPSTEVFNGIKSKEIKEFQGNKYFAGEE